MKPTSPSLSSLPSLLALPSLFTLFTLFTLLLFLLFPTLLIAQIGGIQSADSLQRILPGTKPDRHRVDILNNLGSIYMNINPVEGTAYTRQALLLAEKQAYFAGMADAYLNLANSTLVSSVEGNTNETYKWLAKARYVSAKADYKNGLARIYFLDAMLALNVSDYAACLESANKAKLIYEELNDYYNLVSIYDVLEIMYFQINDIAKGKEMAETGLAMAEKHKSYIFKSEMLYQYGYYVKLSEENNSKGALEYYLKALENSEKHGLNIYSSTVMGYIAHIFTKQEDYLEAIDYYQKSIDIEEKNQIEFSKGWAIYNIAKLYLKIALDSAYLAANKNKLENKSRNDFLNLAITFSEKALVSARKRSERDYIYYICYVMSETYKYLDNYKMARDYYNLTRIIYDSITSIENQRKLTTVETNLLKAAQNKELEIQSRAQTNNILIIIFLTILLSGIVITIVMVMQAKLKAHALLLNILPESIALRLRKKEKPIADYFDKVTVVFIDIAHFTPLFSHLSPGDLVKWLNRIYTDFDRITSKYGLEKIKTIGDCYMAAAGLPEPMVNHGKAAAMFAIAAAQSLHKHGTEQGLPLKFRCGIDCGPVVAGVIGEKKFIYDLWGDTVNIAARMEQTSEPGKIQVTERFKNEIEQNSDFEFIERGQTEIKGKGSMNTWFLQV